MPSCRDNICHVVKSPANVSWKISRMATEVAHRAVSSLEGAGVFAVELFLTEDNKVVIQFLFPICNKAIMLSLGFFFFFFVFSF